ncbi:hypothetical protein PHYSODRAFT_321619 [Phytophthora sojae]|uniref:Uncharacterized protein n=1 Tax=Phytophthora sojae (strain P6497) TaxID=1094619 RepID=G4YPC4_PHYSP|nr:hypothetical protein PHYSODRAFT_321619 [Phytophthora sojae]EGZ27904.1 hypothetical protein PHYSODRAFT_321619 [Phytophthora sojae]|eukprot:XP_009515179.1 hypothetical protein PHYSODRAFT_321619 [Phytophthora sojae]
MSTRGRPRELPSQLPRLNPSIALDPALEGINLRSRGAILEDSWRQRRQAKQTDRARTLARQRGRRQIEELALTYQCAKAAGVTDESKAMLKRCLAEVVLQVTEHDVSQFYFHVEHFMRYVVDRTPVFTQPNYENSHGGDELGLCPILPDKVEALLVSYLPDEFGQFTPEQHRQLEEAFGVQRLTMQAIEALVNGGQPSDVEQSVAL